MTDQQTNIGASGSPGGGAPGGAGDTSTGGSFVRARTAQIAAQQSAQGNEPAADPERQQQQQGQQQQAASAGDRRMIEIGGNQYDEADVQSAIAERAEAAVRKQGLPQAPEGYEVKNSAAFQLPEGVSKFEFDMADPTLAVARKFALANNFTQEQFSGMLDLFVASKSGELLGQLRARESNLQQLGAAGPQRIAAVSTWLKSFAGKDGAQVADFINKWPSAPIVRAMETVIKRFSGQGGADFSQSHRETNTTEAGKIPGYENMKLHSAPRSSDGAVTAQQSRRRAAIRRKTMAKDPRFELGERVRKSVNTDPRYAASVRAPRAGYASAPPRRYRPDGRDVGTAHDDDLVTRHVLFQEQDERMQYKHPVTVAQRNRAR